MPSPKLRLIIAASLFTVWIGFLTYLVVTNVHPSLRDGMVYKPRKEVVSRSQLLLADVVISAELTYNDEKEEVEPEATGCELVWERKGLEFQLPEDKKLKVRDLPEAVREMGAWHHHNAQPVRRSGRYLLPLIRHKDGSYELAPTPATPGYPGTYTSPGSERKGKPYVYEDTLENREQIRVVLAARGEE
jgi:hypothetical protein